MYTTRHLNQKRLFSGLILLILVLMVSTIKAQTVPLTFPPDSTRAHLLMNKVIASDPLSEDGFGFALVRDRDTLYTGAPSSDTYGDNTGVVYSFKWNGSQYIEQTTIHSPIPIPGESFGGWLALNGDVLAISAAGSYGGYDGSVYMYQRNGTDWNFIQKIVSPDSVGSQFGISVDI
ncbi:MAG TPA: hypothetical protein VHL11_09405, partial [Phototrophicaceae bacterium]|nr:hypothetical protein [Phototrophicaceae bacterium]